MEQAPCKGCRQVNTTRWHLPVQVGAALPCAPEKGVGVCCDCEGFPCRLPAPATQGASTCRQNRKVYTLCRIKNGEIEGGSRRPPISGNSTLPAGSSWERVRRGEP